MGVQQVYKIIRVRKMGVELYMVTYGEKLIMTRHSLQYARTVVMNHRTRDGPSATAPCLEYVSRVYLVIAGGNQVCS